MLKIPFNLIMYYYGMELYVRPSGRVTECAGRNDENRELIENSDSIWEGRKIGRGS